MAIINLGVRTVSMIYKKVICDWLITSIYTL